VGRLRGHGARDRARQLFANPAEELLVLWGAIHPEERFLRKRFVAPYATTRGASVAGCKYTDLQQELQETHLPLVDAVARFALAFSDLCVVPRNRVAGAFDPDETHLVVTEGV
jgi:hypothetical protein